MLGECVNKHKLIIMTNQQIKQDLQEQCDTASN